MGNCFGHESKKVRRNSKSRSNFAHHGAAEVHNYAPPENGGGATNSALSKRDLETGAPPPPRPKKTVRFAEEDDNGGGGGCCAGSEIKRVKVVLTKEAAARLLSMFAEGKARGAEDIVWQLNQQQGKENCSGSITSSREITGWTPALETIPEMQC